MEFSQDTIDSLVTWLTTTGVSFAINLIAALAIFVIGRRAANLIARTIGHALDRANVEATLSRFLVRIIRVALLVGVVIAALDTLGFKTTSLIAILGAAGLAIGLALQGSLSNFAAGVMIIIFRPFRVGNFIEAAGVSGIVEEISMFTTIMRTPDNRGVIVPNSSITADAITNFSAKDTRRIDLVFSVSYVDDLKVAQEVIRRVLDADERILKDPAPTVGVNNLGESSIDFVVWPWAKASDYLAVKFHLNETIKRELEAAGCSIPFPQRDVRVFPVEGTKTA
ncbi:MAG: mechanosensitive ion channel family protein [Opitutaceae bacterium]